MLVVALQISPGRAEEAPSCGFFGRWPNAAILRFIVRITHAGDAAQETQTTKGVEDCASAATSARQRDERRETTRRDVRYGLHETAPFR